MASGENDIVSAVMAHLAERIGSDRVQLWFSSGAEFGRGPHGWQVMARSQFVADWLRKNLDGDLQASLHAVTGSGSAVAYGVRSEEWRVEGGELGANTVSHPSEQAPAQRNSKVVSPAALPKPSSLVTHPSSLTNTSPHAPRRFARFDEFIVGDGNRVAASSAQVAARQPGAANPLVLCGPTGSGKTHLLEAIWSDARRAGAMRRIVYLSAEQFTSYFLEALNGSGLPSFRRKYRDVELLLIDDLQFFVGKKATTLELLHTVDTLTRQGRQMVLAADRHPSQLGALGPELVARLSAGLVCQIEASDALVRRGILERLAGERHLPLSGELLDFLAEHLPADARQLSGALHRLKAAAETWQKPLDRELAEETLADMLGASKRSVRLADIERVVCETFGLGQRTLQSDKKSRRISHPRMLAMWLARKYTRAGLSEIGQYFGRRSHSTVVSAQKKIEAWLGEKAEVDLGEERYKILEAVKKVEGELRVG